MAESKASRNGKPRKAMAESKAPRKARNNKPGKGEINTEKAHRKRQENMSSTRKNVRAAIGLENRWMRHAPRFGRRVDEQPTSPTPLDPEVAQKLEKLPQLLKGLISEDPAVKLDSATQIRALLSIERRPPIDELVAAGVVPPLIQLLADGEAADLRVVVAGSLAAIATGSAERCQILIDHAGMPFLIQLLTGPAEAVRVEALRVLGEVAGQSPMYRDYLLQAGIVAPLLQQLPDTTSIDMLSVASQALANLCTGYPLPHRAWVVAAIPLLARLIYSTDEEVLSSACWALAGLTDDGGAGDPSDRLQTAIEAGPVRRLVELLMHPAAAVQIPALRTIGNLLCGTDMQTQVVLNFSVLPCLLLLLSSPKRVLRQDALWALSNVTAGNAEQIQMVIDANVMAAVVALLQTGPYDVKKVAALVISNAVAGGRESQIRYLVSQGCVAVLCSALSTDAVSIALDALAGILARAREAQAADPWWHIVPSAVDECGGLDKLEQLQTHDSPAVFEKVTSLLTTYFEPNPDELMAPETGLQP